MTATEEKMARWIRALCHAADCMGCELKRCDKIFKDAPQDMSSEEIVEAIESWDGE